MTGRNIFARKAHANTAGARAEDGGLVVLQILPAMEAGGVERSVVDVAQAVTAAGGKAIVVSEGGQMVRHLERAGAIHVEMPLSTRNPARSRGNAETLAQLIRGQGVHIVHARDRGIAKTAQTATRRAGRFLVTSFGGGNFADNMLRRARHRVLAVGDRVVAVSEFAAHYLNETYQVEPERIRVIGRGVDLDVYCPDQVSPQRVIRLATEWRLRDGTPLIMMPPRFTAWKGQSALLDAVTLMSDLEFSCVIIATERGRPSNRDELEQMVKRRGLEDRVFVLDHCQDMAAAYMLADAVVCPGTQPEAFGRSIGEAQAMGRPVVASDIGGVRELVLADQTGYLFPAGDEVALARALRRTITLSADQRAHIGRQAEAHARGRFGKEIVCGQMLELYRELLDMAGESWFQEISA